jgi:hypothetical protein
LRKLVVFVPEENADEI